MKIYLSEYDLFEFYKQHSNKIKEFCDNEIVRDQEILNGKIKREEMGEHPDWGLLICVESDAINMTLNFDDSVKEQLEKRIDDIYYARNLSYQTKQTINKSHTIKGYIYAVKCGNKLKLGKTKNLETRFDTYRKTNPDFRIIATTKVDDYTKQEKLLCEKFNAKVTLNEWLDYSEQLENKVKEYITGI